MIEQIAKAGSMDELRALWREANRLGVAHDTAMQAAKDRRKAELAEARILAEVEKHFGPGARITARRKLEAA